ncbi:YtpR family tRNA-binding protein [Listeria booriae]|uniref:DUF4479 domain-containing protein n=1 Tax=Listeria booriae TaxID=1552123 RepID=A0A7X1DM02_9LIST|nr:DUF4479 family protein [Listeria booriae]MBC1211512.1 DUF4479 domain-containing protein [Listeria booriae]MBC1226745.1 DUF4479 domain-containing protein [Listeria booriae]MBC1230180.1 DUF4479 domain-containing protein [Listeria booriae]MBC1271773.1 DUF4479 domain-containing protein [Listeria booriae]MBC1285132.1 DUF4479 domain-containing protein [Listeria booriae]
MIVNAFYNEKGVGDTLLVHLNDVEKTNNESKGNVTRIFDAETGETVAINIFEVSKKRQFDANGKVNLTEEDVAFINQELADNGFDFVVEADLSPKFVVGYVASKEKHPNADKLNVCQVDLGDKTVQIVCGAPNVEAGQKVVVAKIGAVMPSGLIIKPSNLRGEDSFGMICAARELAIPDAPQEKGIMVLDDSYETGAVYPVTF